MVESNSSHLLAIWKPGRWTPFGLYLSDVVGETKNALSEETYVPPCSGLKLMHSSIFYLDCSELQCQNTTAHEL